MIQLGAFFLLVWLCVGCSAIAPEKKLSKPPQTVYSVDDPQFVRSIGHLLSAPMTSQNKITVLHNGDATFPAMLEAIHGAKNSITLEANIWEPGRVTTSFVEALTRKAQAGVKVHVLLDSLTATGLSSTDANILRESGVELVYYNPPHPLRLQNLNNRTHRKLLIVDGGIGFTGGICLSDKWIGDAEPGRWRDTHFRIEGPVVAQMQTVFTENWLQANSSVLHGDSYFPNIRPAGNATAHFFRSGPKDNAENARLSYLLAIAAARKNIRLAHAYFVPCDLTVEALVQARQRGVKVEIILPARSDHYSVARASRTRWGKLLEAGVEFYEYQPTLYHCKIMVVDNQWITAGSVNFSERSFRIDDEANLNALNPDLARQLISDFERDKADSRKLGADDFKGNWFGRGFDHFFGLFRSQM
jgi:cardiolipin synthase